MRWTPPPGAVGVVLAAHVLASAPAEARFLHHYNQDRTRLAHGHSSPNETEPGKAAPILALAPAGVYVSVGTERSFIGAALSPRVTHLLMIDYDSRVVAFSRTNIALLELAHSREDYLRLRMTASFDDWRKAAAEGTVEQYLEPYVRKQSSFDEFRESLQHRGFVPLHDPRFAPFNGEFKDANYLYDDALFTRLSTLAKTGRIQAETLDLAKPDQVHELVADLLRENLVISLLDLSNCWMDDYVPSPGFDDSLNAFALDAAPAGVLLLTNLAPDYLSRLPQIKDPAFMFHSDYVWGYYGFSLIAFSSREVCGRFARSLKNPRRDKEALTHPYLPGKMNALDALSPGH